nr:hypothetical protein [Bosea sp. WAO]
MRSNLHFCFTAPTHASADTCQRRCIPRRSVGCGRLGNGAPGLREAYGPGYYAAFVVDPDGYRLEAYCG